MGPQESLGTIDGFPVAHIFLEIRLDVVEADRPLLIGLYDTYMYRVSVDAAQNFLTGAGRYCTVPLTRKNGHLFNLLPTIEILYKRTDLVRLHKNFFHPTPEKLYSIIQRASPLDFSPSTRRLLD